MSIRYFQRLAVTVLCVAAAVIFQTSTAAGQACNAFVNTCNLGSTPAWTVNDTILTSTGEVGEPVAHSFYTTAQNPLTTNWYHWTAPFNGVVVVNTQGTNPNALPPNYQTPYLMDMVIAAYTGSTLATLVRRDESDDWQPSSPPNCSCTFPRTLPEAFWSSCMMFAVTAGTTYHFQVDHLSETDPLNNNFVLNLYYRVPSSATVSINGRAVNAQGRGASNVRISLVDMNGTIRTALTSSFGYYFFEEVEVGQTYVLSAASKKYQFSNNPRVLSIVDSLMAEDFIEIDSLTPKQE